MSINYNAAYWVNKLQLQPHPEGGYYRETYRSGIAVSREGGTAAKQACTSIYYLLKSGDFSCFHRLQSDELWYFHKGSPLHIHAIDTSGANYRYQLSDDANGSLT